MEGWVGFERRCLPPIAIISNLFPPFPFQVNVFSPCSEKKHTHINGTEFDTFIGQMFFFFALEPFRLPHPPPPTATHTQPQMHTQI